MTHQPPPPPHYPYPPPRPRKGGISTIAIVAIIIGVLCALGMVSFIVSMLTDDKPAAVVTTESEPEPEPAYQPKPADFELTIKILEKQCFGSAGCNIDFRVELAYVGPQPLSSEISYELTYEVKGGDDAYINTLQITGTTYSYQDREFIGTESSKDKLTATVTSVSPR